MGYGSSFNQISTKLLLDNGYCRAIILAYRTSDAMKGNTTMANRWIKDKARKRIYDRDSILNTVTSENELICCYCNRVCERGDTRTAANPKCIATLDHIVPQKELAAAATDDSHFGKMRRDPKNLITVCMACNSSKQHTELFVWCKQTDRDYARIIAEIARRIAIAV